MIFMNKSKNLITNSNLVVLKTLSSNHFMDCISIHLLGLGFYCLYLND